MGRGRFLVASCCLLVLPLLMGAKPAKKTSRLFKDAESVEMFSAIENGDIEVKLIPKDATLSTIIFKNKTKKPLRIELPAAFAGVPVLAQGGGFDDGFGGGGGNGGGQGQGGQQQALGGGLGGGGGGLGGGGGGLGGGGGVFNVAAERVQKVKVKTVCLEHGKKDPNPRVAYEIKAIDSFTKDKQVHEVLNMLGRGEVDQVSAQAAAWHLTDGLTAQQLASKVKVKHLNGSVEMYFSPAQVRQASKIVEVAKHRAEKRSEDTKSSGESEEKHEPISAI